ncbi:quinone oxidoreductase [Zoogloea sp.]|uniref:quinone oxidoreductase family protein n=1 Tax=Zoogloea sp. TaxID=49181 RepID=UPI0035B377CB
MSHLIRFERTGGPEVLQWVEVDVPRPAAGEVQVRHHAVGLNYIDTYHRSGLYPLPLPSGLGQEAAGVVEAVGEGVTEFLPGDRVAYAGGPLGAYAELRNIAAQQLVKLPDSLSFEQGAAMMMQGLTAQYLLRRTYRVQPGDTILIHAAAGGVGLIVCQWAKALGATVIGTVSSDEKAALARLHGCDHAIISTREKVSERVRALTGGAGVNVVYDSIGKDTFLDSLACLRPLGMMVSFGNASGPVEAFDLGLLARMGSLFLTRPTLFTYTARREDLLAMADELFGVVASGQVRITINQRYPLQDAVTAHRDLEARRTTGSTVLIP